MTTDNRTNGPTPEQVEAAAKELAAYEWVSWEAVPSDFKDQYRSQACAALVAAAGAAPQAEGEPMYSLESRQWSAICPCVRQEQVDPECEWHGRPEFRIGGEFHHDALGLNEGESE